MNTVKVDFSKVTGNVKPMHAVNNGPAGGGVRGGGNAEYFKKAGIPYPPYFDFARGEKPPEEKLILKECIV